MEAICSRCHSASYVAEQMIASDQIVREADRMMAEAIRTVKALYTDGILKVPEGWKYTPDLLQFYEARSSVEQELYVMFLEHRMRAFQGAFHANPDYMHWYGWAAMKESLQKIKDEAASLRAQAATEAAAQSAQEVVIKSAQEAAIKAAQEAAQKETADLKSQLDGVANDLRRLTDEIASLRAGVVAGRAAQPVALGAGLIGLIALVVGAMALLRGQGR
jgi:hypothetical protein